MMTTNTLNEFTDEPVISKVPSKSDWRMAFPDASSPPQAADEGEPFDEAAYLDLATELAAMEEPEGEFTEDGLRIYADFNLDRPRPYAVRNGSHFTAYN